MNNLKPNMYIRTKEGKIDKVLEINTEDFDEPVVRLASYPIGMYQGEFEYKKASHNIIDLIEVGDYINGELVYQRTNYKLYVEGNTGEYLILDDGTTDDPIETIVTKEQFSQMEYKVGE